MKHLYDAAIVGGGAAGLSAALTLGRCCRRVLVCDDGRPRNAVARHMHGFMSRDGTSPGELLAIARKELERYSVDLVQAHAARVAQESEIFSLRTAQGKEYLAQRLVLATGLYDALPEVPGLRERWGGSVFVCPYCDGWEFRDRRLAALGKGRRAVELAQELYQWSDCLIVGLQGVNDLDADHRVWIDATRAQLHESELRSISGERPLELSFADGSRRECDAVFLSAPLRQRFPLVEMLGCAVREDGSIEIDARGETSVHGCYAAGDAVTRIHQVAIAAASGVRAAMGVNEDLIAQEVRALTRNIS